MQRRGFLAQLAALVTGAVIAPHVQAGPVDDTLSAIPIPHQPDVPAYTITAYSADVAVLYHPDDWEDVYLTRTIGGDYVMDASMFRDKLKKRRPPWKPGPRKPSV